MVYRAQRQWGWLVATEMFLSGAAAGAYLISVAPFLAAGQEVYLTGIEASLALVLAALGGILADLTSVRLAPRAFAYQRSPVARGAIGLGAFTCLAIATLVSIYVDASPGVLAVAVWLGVIASIFTMVYPGMVLGSMRSIPFWSGAMPVLLLLSAAPLSGAAIVTIIGGNLDIEINLRQLSLWLLVAYGVMLFAHVAMGSQGTPAERAAARQLIAGNLSYVFWVGMTLVGVVLPLFLFAGNAWSSDPLVARFGAVLILAGGLLMRYGILASGVKAPLIPEEAVIPTYWLEH